MKEIEDMTYKELLDLQFKLDTRIRLKYLATQKDFRSVKK